jgi:hypothetical protein
VIGRERQVCLYMTINAMNVARYRKCFIKASRLLRLSSVPTVAATFLYRQGFHTDKAVQSGLWPDHRDSHVFARRVLGYLYERVAGFL